MDGVLSMLLVLSVGNSFTLKHRAGLEDFWKDEHLFNLILLHCFSYYLLSYWTILLFFNK